MTNLNHPDGGFCGLPTHPPPSWVLLGSPAAHRAFLGLCTLARSRIKLIPYSWCVFPRVYHQILLQHQHLLWNLEKHLKSAQLLSNYVQEVPSITYPGPTARWGSWDDRLSQLKNTHCSQNGILFPAVFCPTASSFSRKMLLSSPTKGSSVLHM
jgi:hypothetical protein